MAPVMTRVTPRATMSSRRENPAWCVRFIDVFLIDLFLMGAFFKRS